MVVVYQMGKVGSTTVVKAVGAPQVHTLNPGLWLRTAWPRISRHHLSSIRMRLSPPDKIITGVREPVARNLSAFMQNHKARRWHAEPETFFSRYNHDRPIEWFDKELKKYCHVDVFEYPFPHAQGWQIIDDRVLILRAEADDEAKEEGLRRFLGRPIKLSRANVGAQKSYAEDYAKLKSAIRFPADYLDRMYESRYARHFYTPEEIERYRARWS